jgi:hypothetical protein
LRSRPCQSVTPRYAILDATGNSTTGTGRATIGFNSGRGSLRINGLDGTAPFGEVLENNTTFNMNNAPSLTRLIILNNHAASVTSALLGTGIDDSTDGALCGLISAGLPDKSAGMFTAQGFRGKVAGVRIAD